MAKIWDALMKMLVRANPQDFVSFLTQGTCYQGDVTNELIIRSVDADFLCQAIKNEQDVIVHAEYQRRNLISHQTACALVRHLSVERKEYRYPSL